MTTPPLPQKISGPAIASLVLGILSLFTLALTVTAVDEDSPAKVIAYLIWFEV